MKTKNVLMYAISSMVVLSLVSCRHEQKVLEVFDEEAVTEKRKLTGFEEVEVLGSPTVYYVQADSFSVVVKGPKGLVENILTEVDGTTLKVRNRGKMGIFNIRVDDMDASVFVTSPDIVGIRLSGSGDFISERPIDSDKIDILLRGSGDISIDNLICDDCTTSVVGSGDATVRRLEARRVSASLVGSGNVSLGLWKVDDTNLQVTGSGDIDVAFNEGCQAAECELRGSGDITLKGHVAHFTKHKTGSGDIDTDKLVVR